MRRRVITGLRLSAASIAVAIGSYGSAGLAQAAFAGTNAVEEQVQTETSVDQGGNVPRTDIVDPAGVPETAPEGVVVVGIRRSVAISRAKDRVALSIDSRSGLSEALGLRDGAQAGAIDEVRRGAEVAVR